MVKEQKMDSLWKSINRVTNFRPSHAMLTHMQLVVSLPPFEVTALHQLFSNHLSIRQRTKFLGSSQVIKAAITILTRRLSMPISSILRQIILFSLPAIKLEWTRPQTLWWLIRPRPMAIWWMLWRIQAFRRMAKTSLKHFRRSKINQRPVISEVLHHTS